MIYKLHIKLHRWTEKEMERAQSTRDLLKKLFPEGSEEDSISTRCTKSMFTESKVYTIFITFSSRSVDPIPAICSGGAIRKPRPKAQHILRGCCAFSLADILYNYATFPSFSDVCMCWSLVVCQFFLATCVSLTSLVTMLARRHSVESGLQGENRISDLMITPSWFTWKSAFVKLQAIKSFRWNLILLWRPNAGRQQPCCHTGLADMLRTSCFSACKSWGLMFLARAPPVETFLTNGGLTYNIHCLAEWSHVKID